MTMDYQLIRSKRKTLAIEITRDARLVVRAPLRCPQAKIDRFLAEKQEWIALHLQKMRQRRENHPEPTAEEEALLRQKAKALLPLLVERYSAQMGVSSTGITVTGARTRFGSCSPKNRLCFSFRLMGYPLPAIEYVVVHELAHIRHKNHGPDFYAEIEKVLPDWKTRNQLLKQ
jgi:predicted metal-dependent hydrolase